MRTEIPLLQNVRIASPCPASWEEMMVLDGDRVRFCAGCQKRVYNLSAMGQAEAEGLLRRHEGRLCARYYRRDDGSILTADCPVGMQAMRRLAFRRAKVSVSLLFLIGAVMAANQTMTRNQLDGVGGQVTTGVLVPTEITPAKPPVVRKEKQIPHPEKSTDVPVMGKVASWNPEDVKQLKMRNWSDSR